MMMKLLLVAVALCVAVSANEELDVRVRLVSAHKEAAIEAEFVARSTPGSPTFRQWLSLDQVTALVGAPQPSVRAVEAWLKAHGATRVKVAKTRDDVLATFPSADHVAKAFRTHLGQGKTTKQSLNIPTELSSYVESVLVPHAFPRVRRNTKVFAHGAKKQQPDFPGERQIQNPPVIRTRYNIPTENKYAKMAALMNYSHAVAEFQGQFFRQDEIAAFNYAFDAPLPRVRVYGPNHLFGPSGETEGSLDVEYINTLCPNTTTYWVSDSEFDLVGEAQRLVGDISPHPSVVSISWGGSEADFEPATLDAVNKEYRKIGMMGVTITIASGDSGTCSRSGSSPVTQFPTSSPYVTAVGATIARTANQVEASWSMSGGGFSAIFTAPSWQTAATKAYLAGATNLPPAGTYNASGRGVPDVAALGSHFNISVHGGFELVDGTSCASPTFAAVISLVNMERISMGKPTLGFLNPAIYALGKVGTDITSGVNNAEGQCDIGFTASAGWDPLTGLGSPDYEYLRANL